jgi:transposase
MEKIDAFITGVLLMLLSIFETGSGTLCEYLVVDRTNWKRGKKNVNLLTIGGLFQNNFVPLMWTQLDKRGNSNFDDRKNLITRLLSLLAQSGRITKGAILLADREFIGSHWFRFLISQELSFVVRLRENMYFELQTVEGLKRTPLKHFNKQIERFKIFAIPMVLDGTTYSFVMIKNPKYNPKEPYIYFISNLTDAKKIAAHYLKRWKIECAFKHLKTNGFNLEDCNLKSDVKIELLMTIVVVAYVIAIREGVLVQHKIPIKKYKNGTQYPAISIFRKGYEILQNTIQTLLQIIKYIEQLVTYQQPKLNINKASTGFV